VNRSPFEPGDVGAGLHPSVAQRVQALDPPAADPVPIEWLAAHHLGAKLDPLAEPEVVHVLVQVGEHLLPAREVGILARHRKVAVLGRVAGADDLGRLVEPSAQFPPMYSLRSSWSYGMPASRNAFATPLPA
jgi:hypothetical protein